MAEFSAQDALRPRWDPSLRSRAIRVFMGIAVVLIGVALLGYGVLRYFRPKNEELVMLILVAGPVLTAMAMTLTAVVIAWAGVLSRIISRLAFPIFLGSLVGVIVLVWAHGFLFDYVHRLVERQTEAQRAVYTAFGGELTIGEIQSALLTRKEIAANEAALYEKQPVPYPPHRGRLSLLAYLLWPLQFTLVRDLFGLIAVVGFASIVAMFGIWWERKVAGRIQSRLGPMRVGGWHGWAQSLADGIKLLQKEDILLEGADKPLFRLAPYLAFVPALAAFIALPFGAMWVFRDLDVGLIFILAMLGVGVVGVLLAGWASNNKWSVYGAMRVACQMVSYEIPMGMSLLVPIMTAGSLRLTTVGEMQAGGFHHWLAFANPFTFAAAVTYFIAALASCKRAPFDLPEAESELVSGYHTEYSGFRFSLFFFAEYAEMFIISALATILFFGAWHSPLPASLAVRWWGEPESWGLGQQALHGLLFSGPLWLIAKSFFFFYVQIWIRWTLPRIRLDQVMYACVQVLLPIAMLVLLGNTIWGLVVEPGSIVARTFNILLTLVGAGFVLGFVAIMVYGYVNRRRLPGPLVVDHLPGA